MTSTTVVPAVAPPWVALLGLERLLSTTREDLTRKHLWWSSGGVLHTGNCTRNRVRATQRSCSLLEVLVTQRCPDRCTPGGAVADALDTLDALLGGLAGQGILAIERRREELAQEDRFGPLSPWCGAADAVLASACDAILAWTVTSGTEALDLAASAHDLWGSVAREHHGLLGLGAEQRPLGIEELEEMDSHLTDSLARHHRERAREPGAVLFRSRSFLYSSSEVLTDNVLLEEHLSQQALKGTDVLLLPASARPLLEGARDGEVVLLEDPRPAVTETLGRLLADGVDLRQARDMALALV